MKTLIDDLKTLELADAELQQLQGKVRELDQSRHDAFSNIKKAIHRLCYAPLFDEPVIRLEQGYNIVDIGGKLFRVEFDYEDGVLDIEPAVVIDLNPFLSEESEETVFDVILKGSRENASA